MIKNQNYYLIIFYTILFGYLFLYTLNTNYVEGDDASTILYHLCGHNNLIQRPYAAYQCGFDFLLKYIPASNEIFFRTTAVYITFGFGFLMLLVNILFFNEVFDHGNNEKFYFLLLLPFVIPQVIFQTLLLNSTNISFTFALLSLVFFIKYLKSQNFLLLIISAFLMALSIPFRWSILTFYPVFLSFFFMYNPVSVKNSIVAIKQLSFFTFFSLSIGICVIYISGYAIQDLLNAILFGKQYMDNSERSIFSLFAMATPFLTPQLVFLCIVGLYFYFKKLYKNIKFYIILVLPLLPYFILGFLPDLKYSISLLPLILVVAYKGFLYVSSRNTYKLCFIISIFILWFIGISINLENSMFGPSFEFKNKKTLNLDDFSNISKNNVDQRIKFKSIKPIFDGGVYMPTAEGGRPLFGYYHVLLHGGWYNNIEKFKNSRDYVISKLDNNNNIIFLQDRQTAFLQADLFRFGYKTKMDFKFNPENQMHYRNFTKRNKTIKLQITPDSVDKEEFISNFFKSHNNVIYRSSYSSSILKILNQNKNLEFIDIYTICKFQK